MKNRKVIISLSILLSAAFLVRLGLGLYGLETLERPDSAGYIEAALHPADPGSARAPGFPLFLGVIYTLAGTGNHAVFVAVISLLGVLSALPVYFSAREWGASSAWALAAAAMYLFNPTALGNSALILSDTLFMAVISVTFYLFTAAYKRKCLFAGLAGMALAGAAALIRPINLLWYIPGGVLLFFIFPHDASLQGKKLLMRRILRFAYVLCGVALFGAVLLPRQLGNLRRGAGFCIDTNTGALYHQNGAMLLAKVNNSSYEAEKQRILSKVAAMDFATPAEEVNYRLAKFRELIKKHPQSYITLHLSSQIYLLLPDLPSLCETLRLTVPNRGTMEILQKNGIIAAADHYFEGRRSLIILSGALLILSAVTLAGALAAIIFMLKDFRHRYYYLLLAGAFAEYYLLLPGPITAPRYLLPALPAGCCAAACGLAQLIETIRKQKYGKNNTDKAS